MMDFTVTPLRTNTVAYVERMRGLIQLDPVYQRQGEVWSRAKQALLIDSIINQFDIPKIYFHQHAAPIVVDGKKYKYSLVDGRQRLEAIWDFMDGKFALAEDFVHLETGSTSAAGKTYRELQAEEDHTAMLFGASPLDIMCIQTDDVDLIEEMFSRLNEAVPLTAAEKRNGRGGPLRTAVRTLCDRELFTNKLPFGNKRYRHYDLATKLLLLAQESGPHDTKKRQLDDFWEEFKVKNDTQGADELSSEVGGIIDSMEETFTDNDPLLAVVGMISVYFLYFWEAARQSWPAPSRSDLVAFEKARKISRFNDEEDLTREQRRLLEFGRLAQSPNDEGALRFRLEVLTDYLRDPARFD
ncbi:DUF262 domain-containing protein [Promicromonospora panici]|uniref:DUF262 domain-containing protein n=1 Tax=Promicromonospora panici TaxID=2219658 RepID=UPI00101C6030|nr:DUF262 domain-containing protein [Promicromonospora panici]